jgi:DNA-binding GntR family transcriptional regulator
MTGRLEIDAKPEMSAGRTTAGRRSAITSKNHPNLKDVAEAFISQGIVSGRFQPGAKVDQD